MPNLDWELLKAAEAGDLAGTQSALAALAAAPSRYADSNVMALGEALLGAATHNRLAVVQHLIATGADVLAYQGRALSMAAARGHLAIVQCVLAAGADVHSNNDLALKLASENGHMAVVQCLLAAGADVRADSDYALTAAVNNRHAAMVRLLRAHGADLKPILLDLPAYAPALQVAALAAGDVVSLSPPGCAHLGICPEALCMLLSRQGMEALAATLSATKMLEPLATAERASLLEDLLMSQAEPELTYAEP